MSDYVLEIGEDLFEKEVLEAELPVLVDFWAPWCGPCSQLGPVVEDLAEAYSDRLKVVKVNVDENQSLAMEYGITSIPTLIFYQDGNEVETMVGLLSKDQLEEKIEELI